MISTLTREQHALQEAIQRKRERRQQQQQQAQATPRIESMFERKSATSEPVARPLDIPTRAFANNAGCTVPNPVTFELTMGILRDIDGVEVPEIPDTVFKLAYELLPAFLMEYGDKYDVRASTILNRWIESIKDGDSGYIDPWLFQRVVYCMAEEGSVFNERTMRAVTKRIAAENRETADEQAIRFSQRDPYRYEYFRSVNPDSAFKDYIDTQDWLAIAQYPQAFPTDQLLTSTTMQAINTAVQLRFQSESDFCSVCARFLAGTMCEAVQGLRREKGVSVSQHHVWDLAYRYPVSYILDRHEHQAKAHGNIDARTSAGNFQSYSNGTRIGSL